MKRRAIKELMKLMEAEVADIPEVGGNLADNDTTESFGTNPGLTWQEVRNPTIPAWYRPADSDAFPIGTYIKMKSGKIIQNIFKLGHSWCHYYSDVEALLKKFQFKLVYSAQHFEPGEKNIGAKNFYEIEHETGILLMLTAGYPIPISGGKIDPKSKIYIQLISNLDVNLFDNRNLRSEPEVRLLLWPSQLRQDTLDLFFYNESRFYTCHKILDTLLVNYPLLQFVQRFPQ